MNHPLSLLILAAAAVSFTCCSESGKKADTRTASVNPTIEAVLTTTEPAAAVSVLEVRKSAKPGDTVTVTGMIAGVESPFTDGFASIVLGDHSMKTCDKVDGDSCETPWDACCEDPAALKGARLMIQVVDSAGRPVAQGLKGVSGLKELDHLVVEGVVTEDSSPENLVINVNRLFRKPKA